MIRTALTCCSALIIIALGLGVSDAVNIQTSLSGLAKRLNDFTLIKRGVDSLTDIITTVLKEVTKTLGYQVRGLDENGEVPDDISKWVNQLKTFTTTRKQSLQNDFSACAEIDDMNTRYTNMRLKYKDNRVLSVLLDKFQGAIVNLVALAYQVNPCTAKSRVEPVVLMLKGKSGVGKSSLLYHFATQVLAQTNAIAPAMTDLEIQEKIQSCIYPRSSENEYWEGYANQPCTLVDDAFQIVDSTSNPNLDYMELLRMSNPFPYPLHMATLSQKANTNFTSRVVIYTTNVDLLKPSSFVAPEAVQRRVTMPYSVHIKREFADCHGQLLEEFRTGQIDTEVYEFFPWDVKTGRIAMNDPRSYQDLVDELSRKMMSNETKFRSQTADLVGVARTMMSRQVAPREPVASTSSATLQFNPLEWMRRNQVDNDGELIIHPPEPARELDDTVPNEILFEAMLRRVGENHPNPRGNVTDERIQEMIEYRRQDRRNERYDRELRRFSDLQYFHKWCSIPKEAMKHFKSLYSQVGIFGMALGLLSIIMLAFSLTARINSTRRVNSILWCPDKYPRRKEIMSLLEQISAPTFTWSEETQKEYDNYVTWLSNFDNEKVEELKTFVESKLESGKSRVKKLKNLVKLEDKINLESGKSRVKKQELVRLEGWNSDNARDVCAAVQKSQKILTLSRNGNTLSNISIIGLFVRDRWFAVNTHYIILLDKLAEQGDFQVHFHNNNDSTFSINWSDVKIRKTYERAGSKSDISFIEVPNINRYPDLTHHIPRIADGLDHVGKKIVMVHKEDNIFKMKFGNVLAVHDKSYIGLDEEIHYAQSITTSINSESGECGAIYILDTPTSRRRIVGFHFAGSQGLSHAIPLVFEDIEKAIGPSLPSMKVEMDLNAIAPSLLQGHTLVLGRACRLGKPVHQHYPQRTKLMKTWMFNEVYESEVEPANLSSRLAENEALWKGMMKQFGSVTAIDSEIMSKASFDYKQTLSKMYTPNGFNILTYDEAVQGIEGDDFIRGICRQTSAGFPYTYETVLPGKTEWFGKDEWTLNSEKSIELRAKIQLQIETMEQGGDVDYIFVDSLKDETRLTSKVLSRKTRVFAAAPLDFIVVFRMYYMDFLATMMKNRIENESAVGIVAQGADWHRLAEHLQRKDYSNKSVVAGDFSNFDGTLNTHILWQVHGIIESFYRADPSWCHKDAMVREALWRSIVNSKHICHGWIYQLDHAQPSGNPATAITNTMYNCLATRYVFYKIMDQEKLNYSFNNHVSMIAYGDDNVINISQAAREYFNSHSIPLGFAEIGMTYTDAHKIGSVEFQSLEQTSFLKRSFRYCTDMGMYTAPLEISSILECFNWIHRTEDELGVIKQNFEMANLELSFYEEAFFNSYMKKLQQAIFRTYKVVLPIKSRTDVIYQLRHQGAKSIFAQENWT